MNPEHVVDRLHEAQHKLARIREDAMEGVSLDVAQLIEADEDVRLLRIAVDGALAWRAVYDVKQYERRITQIEADLEDLKPEVIERRRAALTEELETIEQKRRDWERKREEMLAAASKGNAAASPNQAPAETPDI